jgi:hypothetical protein
VCAVHPQRAGGSGSGRAADHGGAALTVHSAIHSDCSCSRLFVVCAGWHVAVRISVFVHPQRAGGSGSWRAADPGGAALTVQPIVVSTV